MGVYITTNDHQPVLINGGGVVAAELHLASGRGV